MFVVVQRKRFYRLKVLFRKKYFKISFIVLTSLFSISALSMITYIVVSYINNNKISYSINLEKISNNEEFKNKTINEIGKDDIVMMLIDYFQNNESSAIKTPFHQIEIIINKSSSNSINGVISFYTSFTLENDQLVSGEFTISGFKKLLQPNKLPFNLSLADQPLSENYPESIKKDVNLEATLKEFIFTQLENKPDDLKLIDFNIKINSASNWSGDIKIKYWLNNEKYYSPSFEGYLNVINVKKYNLQTLVPGADGLEMFTTPEFSDTLANEATILDIRNIIKSNLIGSDNEIPLLLDDISLEINNVDHTNGQISVNFGLTMFKPTLYYQNVWIKNFKILRPEEFKLTKIDADEIMSKITANKIQYSTLQKFIFDQLSKPEGLDLKSYQINIIINSVNNDIGIIDIDVNIPIYTIKPYIIKNLLVQNFAVNRPQPLDEPSYLAPNYLINLDPNNITNEALSSAVLSFMSNVPFDLFSSDIEIISKQVSQDENHKNYITISGYIPKYNDRLPYTFRIKIVGFN